ncbi:MAG: outer membrane protein assembly factor BamA [Deltaproteobacteria bacterium]|nr:outer membrane protein assembly factor BamA [Deltaproteobacteria bacterium]MCL5278189.1 outer membrane protein assembly factor BamA [Deltaproteobacteria bacterium]
MMGCCSKTWVNLLLLTTVLITPFFPASLFADQPVVEHREVEGNRRIQRQVILQNVRQAAGKTLSEKTVDEDILRLFGLGYFDSVEVYEVPSGKGIELIYEVAERPLIREITFKGNSEIDTDKLKGALTFKPRSFFNKAEVSSSIDKIIDMYKAKGYYNVNVTYEVRPISTMEVNVVITVKEGEVVKIGAIDFIGNRSFSDRELRSKMESSPPDIFSFITGSGKFNEAELDRDITRLTLFYMDHGYINIKIEQPHIFLDPDGRTIDIVINIEEGERYKISSIDIQGDLMFPKDELMKKIRSRPGEWFNRSKLMDDIFRLTDIYTNNGYAFANINPETSIDGRDRTVSVQFQISKGLLTYINRISISGNTKTRDKVIRRQMKIHEGELYKEDEIKASKELIYSTGFFDNVDISTAKGTAEDDIEKMDLNVKVKEGHGGMAMLGGGYSSYQQFFVTAQVQLQNLAGLGTQLNLMAQVGGITQQYSISYSDPYFLDTNWSMSASLYNMSNVYPGYTTNDNGGNLQLGYWLVDRLRIFANYGYDDAYFSGISSAYSYLLQNGVTSAVTLGLIQDTRDNPIYTTKGALLNGSAEFAGGPLAGSFTFIKFDASASRYFPLPLGTVLMLNGRIGYGYVPGNGFLPFTSRYFLGGINSVRGYNYRTIGPEISALSTNIDPLAATTQLMYGGNKMIATTVEYVFPLIKEAKIDGVIFFDTGNAYAENQGYFATPLQMGYGAGIRWFTPIAPFRFEWGFPLNPRPTDQPNVFEFSIGTFY